MAAKKKTVNGIDMRLTALRNDFEALQQDIKGLASDVGVAASERAQLAMRSAEDVADRAMRLAEEAVRARDRVKVLDVGCYTGQFREYLRLRKPARTIEYVGVDVAPPQVTFPIYTDLDAVPDRDFDLILMSEVAEHMPADVFVREYLARFPAMLASDGMLVVSVPNPTCPGALERDVTHVQHYPWYDLYALLRRHFGKVEVMRTHFIASPRRFCTLPLRWALSYALEFDWCEGLVLTARDPRPIPD